MVVHSKRRGPRIKAFCPLSSSADVNEGKEPWTREGGGAMGWDGVGSAKEGREGQMGSVESRDDGWMDGMGGWVGGRGGAGEVRLISAKKTPRPGLG